MVALARVGLSGTDKVEWVRKVGERSPTYNKGEETNMNGLVVTTHLFTMGGGALDAIRIATHLSHFMNVKIATLPPISPQVMETIPNNIRVVSFTEGMQRDYDIMFNVCQNYFVSPLAKRNIARIFIPSTNKPPEGYELFAVSEYSAKITQDMWGIPCEVLYPLIEKEYYSGTKGNIILNVARFAAPNAIADKGQSLLIEVYKAIAISRPDWQLVLIGSLEPGQEQFFAQLNAAARGYNIKLLPNAESETLKKYYSQAAIYWHATGMGSKNVLEAQEHFGITVVEAMSAGCVPITHGTGGQPEIVEHRYDGFLVYSAQEMYDITMGIISHPSSWSIISQRAEISAERFFNSFDAMKNLLEKKPVRLSPKKTWLTSSYSEENVSIIIPVHNLSEFTMRCLKSIKKLSPNVEVVLIDNASTDETTTVVKDFVEKNGWKYVRREVNDGFAKSINFGKEYCTREFILLLNNDTEAIQEQWLNILLSEMRDEKVGIVGPKLIFPDNTIQFAGGKVDWKTGKGIHYEYRRPDSVRASQRGEVEFITGACLLIRKNLLEMDEDFKLNGEDVALCYNVMNKNFKVIYQPGAILIHYERKTKNIVAGSIDKEEESSAILVAKYGKE